MAYLRLQDYLRFIAQEQLDEVTDEKVFVRLDLEPTAEEEAISHLVQKYDMAREFTGISVYDPTKTYKALSRVYLDASAWSSAVAYTANNQVTASDGNVYRAINGTTNINPISNAGDWEKLGYQYQFFNGIVPKPEWAWDKGYKIGNQIWYKDNTYTALQESRYVFPDDETNGQTYWGTPAAYTIAANTLTDATKWAEGDTRCQRLVECVVMLTLEKMYKHTAAQNVPKWLLDNYDRSIGWLINAAKGESITPPLVELPGEVGHRIRITGNPKNVNRY